MTRLRVISDASAPDMSLSIEDYWALLTVPVQMLRTELRSVLRSREQVVALTSRNSQI